MKGPLRRYRLRVNGHEAELQLTEDDAQALGAVLVEGSGSTVGDDGLAEHKTRSASRASRGRPARAEAGGGGGN
ncbi:hypothetical protein ACIRRH_15440 [Kitasatospora sp. NPDC101235]|uniref:hypothetical protein n=1 Tax=Kitasatospora sp. NPDC101235 TaxID=3364101 RepID=UPI00380D0BB3